MFILRYFAIIILSFFLFVGCKPTEKGYKAAYDAALGKRQATSVDFDASLGVGTFQLSDGPQLKEIDGQQVYVLNQPLKNLDNQSKLPHSYNVAVGTYKMLTNCSAQVSGLKEDGYDAFVAIDSEDRFFSVAGSFQTMKEALTFYNKYRQKKGQSYVGFPDSPVIIFSP